MNIDLHYNCNGKPFLVCIFQMDFSQLYPRKPFPITIIEARLCCRVSCIWTNVNGSGIFGCSSALCKQHLLFHPFCCLNKSFTSQSVCFAISQRFSWGYRKPTSSFQEVMSHSEKIRQLLSVAFVRLFAATLLVTSVSVAVSNAPSCKFHIT